MTRTTAYQHLQTTILRGGRLTKWKGIVASIAPMVGVVTLPGLAASVSPLALAVMGMMIGASPAEAQCAPGPNTYTCSGMLTSQQALSPAPGNDLTVTTAAEFGITTVTGEAFKLTNSPGDGSIIFTDQNESLIQGYLAGIQARNGGSGAIHITATGQVIGTYDVSYGIFADNFGASTSLTIHSAYASGGRDGIFARNYGTDAIHITTTGKTIGESRYGVFAYNRGTSTDVIIDTAEVSGMTFGIFALNDGSGEVNITTQGPTTGTNVDGIYASNSSSGTSLAITTGGTVIGGNDGIDARNYGTAGLTIKANADVTGQSGMGIRAYNSANDTTASMVITQAAGTTTTGAIDGIYADNAGGSLTITALGTSVGTAGAGIFAINKATATSLDVTAHNVRGGYSGIYTRSYGSGGATITLTGTAQGGRWAAIDTVTAAGSPISSDPSVLTTINLEAGSQALAGSSGIAIRNNDGNSLVNAAGLIKGVIDLDGDSDTSLAGSDILNILATADVSGVTLFDGGDDHSTVDGRIDVLTFDAWSGAVSGARIINWESVVVDGGLISFSDGALTTGSDGDTGLFIANGGSVDGGDSFALTGNLSIGAGSTFIGTGGGAGIYTISGTVRNDGTISTEDGAVGDTVSIAGNYTGAGQILMDVDTATDSADTFAIAGGSSGTTGVVLNNLSPNAATGTDITLITVAGTSAAGDFFLTDGPLFAGAFQYDLEYLPGSFVLAAALSSTGAVYEAVPHVLLDGFTRMPTLEQRVGQRRWAASEGAVGPLEATSGGWLRIHGDWADAELNSGTSYETDSWGLQAGIDLPSEAGENGQWVFGLTAQTGNVSSDVATATGTGSVDAESFGLGVTATWYGYDAFYVDMQAQMNWASVDYASSVQGVLAEGEDATTGAASIEIGKRFALNETSGLIPQAQLTWGSLNGDSFTDSAGNAVDFGTSERLIGRIGLAYDQQWQDANRGTMQSVYGIVNLLQDVSNSASVTVAGATLASEADATWGEIGLGGSYSWDNGKRLYGEASYREVLGSGSGSALVATAGVQIQW
jgi:fibronectin-binding autotransporter adhesin